jgi:hypothetical protein
MLNVPPLLAVLLLCLACTQGKKTPSRARVQAAAAPRSAESATPAASHVPEQPRPQEFTLRAFSDFDSYKIHVLADGTRLVSNGLALGRIQGDRLEWDAELSRGLPQRWDESVYPEIETVEGRDVESAWLELGAGCATPPMASGYPIEFEFARRGGRWKLVPMDQRRRWRGKNHYLAGTEFTWAGKDCRLLVVDNPLSWVDGKVEDEDFEDVSYCLGLARVVDPEGRDIRDLVLPKDLCVASVASAKDTPVIAGLDGERRLVLELRDGTKVTRHGPAWEPGCHFAESVRQLRVDFRGPRDADISGARRCPDGRVDDVALHFDGQHFTAARLMPTKGAQHAGIRLPREEKLEIDKPNVEEVFDSEGVTWVVASCPYQRCMDSWLDKTRLLYSSVKGPRRDGIDAGKLDLRFIETCLPHGARITILADTTRRTAFTDEEIALVTSGRHVPDDCPIIEVMTPTQHLLGIPHEQVTEGEPCAEFVAAPGRRQFCAPLDTLANETQEPDSNAQNRYRVRRGPSRTN